MELTLDEAVNYALQHNRTLKSNDIDLEIKERAAKYSWNVFLPTVQASHTFSRATEISPTLAAAGKSYNTEEDHWSFVSGLSASLNLSLSYIWKIRSAKADFEAGKITREQEQKKTLLSIKKLFYGLLLQQENIKIQKTTLENKRQRMVQAQTNYRNGTIPELSLLQTQVDYQNARPDVESAEQTLTQNLDSFVFLLGLPVGTKIELKGSIEPKYIEADADSLIEQYGTNDLSIRSMQSNIDIMKMNLKALNLASWTPALSINYGWQPAYIGADGAFHFWGDIGKDEKWYDSGTLSVTLAFNITNALPWSANRQQAKDLKANIDKLNLSMDTLRENQKVEVKKAVDTLKLAKSQIDAMSRNVTLAQRAYDSTYRQYRNGAKELLDLRDAETSLNQARLGLLNQKYQYISALMDLENTLNTNLSETEE